ncbi:MAG: glycoside hydrolase domain-containing protein [Candidatus Firestonebacteria bacterium]
MIKRLLVAALIVLCAPLFLSAAENSNDDKNWKMFQVDHKDFKDIISTIKIRKKIDVFKEVPYIEKNIYELSADEKQKGYALFSKSCSDNIYPNSKPSKDDALKELSGSGVKGQFLPLVFCLIANEDLAGVEVTASDLVGEGGTIAKENIVPSHIQYEYKPVGEKQILQGRYLAKGPCEIPEGLTRAFWLTAQIPVDAKSGIYKGEFTVVVPGKASTVVPVSLEVFPFNFAEQTKLHTWWMWYYNGYPENDILEQHMVNLKNHGMNCFDSKVPVSYKINGDDLIVNFSTADRVAPLIKKHGFTKWMFDNNIYFQIAKESGEELWSPRHKKLYKSLLSQINEKAKAGGWPEIIWMLDEPREYEDDRSRTYRTYKDVQNYCSILKEMNTKSSVSWTGGYGYKKAQYAAIMPESYLTTTHALYKPCDVIIETANELKMPLLLYNCGATRYAFGVLVKQNNALGNSQFWWGAAGYGNPTSPYASASCAVLKRDGSVVDTVEWEQIREGVYDYNYLWTLEQAIKNYKGSNMSALRNAETILRGGEAIKFPKGTGDATGVDFMSEHRKDFKGSQLDQMRLLAARAIEDLK